MLHSEYLLIAALIFVLLALITSLVIFASRGRASRSTVKRKDKAAVSMGAEMIAGDGIGGDGIGSEDDTDEGVVGPGDEVAETMVDAGQAGDETDSIVVGVGDENLEELGGEIVDGPPKKAKEKAPISVGALSTGFAVVALNLLTWYIGVRMYLTGHGPFADMHEFAVSFSWGILVAYLISFWRFRVRMLSLIVLPVTAALLVYAMSIDSSIDPLVPALQNNLLLTLHVGFAIVSYGAACVSFGAAVLYLIHPKLKLKSRRDQFDEIGYKAAIIAFPLMTVMILLGSLWAKTAWGRYWGWDPKETAALVTWLLYVAFLHARVVRGWRGKKSAILLIVGFAAVLFAYFGNYFFGGLHSYT